MSTTSMSDMNLNNLNTIPDKPKQWNGCSSTETRTNTSPVLKPPPAQAFTEIWNCLAKISPFSLWICSRDLRDTADHWENSHKQLFMHSKAVITEQQSLKDAVTESPALPGEEASGWCGRIQGPGCTKPLGSFLVCRVWVADGQCCRSVLLLLSSPALPPRHRKATAQLLLCWGSWFAFNLETSQIAALSARFPPLFHAHENEKQSNPKQPFHIWRNHMWRLWWAAHPLIPQWRGVGLFTILPCAGRAFHQPRGFPVLMSREEGGGMPAGFDHTAQISSSFFPHSC